MKLTFMQRMMILQVLPETGSFITIKVVRKLREDLSASEKEYKHLGITEDAETGRVNWDQTKDKLKEVEIGEIASEMIKKKLKEMDSAEELTPNHESLYEMFVD